MKTFMLKIWKCNCFSISFLWECMNFWNVIRYFRLENAKFIFCYCYRKGTFHTPTHTHNIKHCSVDNLNIVLHCIQFSGGFARFQHETRKFLPHQSFPTQFCEVHFSLTHITIHWFLHDFKYLLHRFDYILHSSKHFGASCAISSRNNFPAPRGRLGDVTKSHNKEKQPTTSIITIGSVICSSKCKM